MARLLNDIWQSNRSLPLWVQIWVNLILIPANVATVFFLDQPFGKALAVMALGGLAVNAVFLLRDRGFSKVMAIPHLIFWTPLLLLLLGMLTGSLTLSPAFGVFVWVLFVVDAISLGFDIGDTAKWVQGDRDVSRPGSGT